MRKHLPSTIIHLLDTLEGGGTERTLLELLRVSEPKGPRHAVVTLRAAGALSARLPDHVACYALNGVGRRRTLGLELGRYARRRHAAVVHARNSGTWFDAIAASIFAPDIRLMLGFHGWDSAGPPRVKVNILTRLALMRGAHFVTNSHAGGRQLCFGLGVPADRMTVIPNGVDISRFAARPSADATPFRERWGVSKDACVIGAVGALIPVKRFDILIQAFATLLRNSVNATLLIVGEGPERRALESLARTAGATERVIFVGAQEDVPGLLACMDIFACSSESESMSCAVLEAMAAALPMVVTDVGDNAAIVRDSVEGLVVPPGSAESLGRALAQLVVAPDLRRRMSAAAGRRAADFSFAAMVSGYRALYARFAGGCSEMKDSSAQHRDRRIGAAFV